MAKTMHIGKINSRLERVFAGMADDVAEAHEWLNAAKLKISGLISEVSPRNQMAAVELDELSKSLANFITEFETIMSKYENEFYEDTTDSATHESLVATAKAVSKDVVSYMSACVLSTACHNLMQEIYPEKAEKTTADNIGKFLSDEGIDFTKHCKLLNTEMKRICDETDNAWQGRCTLDKLSQEFPESNIPMKVALIAGGYGLALEDDPAVAKYLKKCGVRSGAIPLLQEDAVLDACVAIFDDIKGQSKANAAKAEKWLSYTELKELLEELLAQGMKLRDIEGKGGDEMSLSAFLLKLKSCADGCNPMMDVHLDNEGVCTIMDKKGDKYGIVCDELVSGLLGSPAVAEEDSDDQAEVE